MQSIIKCLSFIISSHHCVFSFQTKKTQYLTFTPLCQLTNCYPSSCESPFSPYYFVTLQLLMSLVGNRDSLLSNMRFPKHFITYLIWVSNLLPFSLQRSANDAHTNLLFLNKSGGCFSCRVCLKINFGFSIFF